MDNILNINDKLVDRMVRELISNLEGLTPEERYLLIEKYCNNSFSIEDFRVG